MKNAIYGLLLVLTSLTACKDTNGSGYSLVDDPYGVVAVEDDHLNMIVEIPAGSSHKIEFDSVSQTFVNDRLADGSDRIIQFLPYPGNYGFIPGTLMDRDRGGDGDPLDVFLIGESQSTGSLIPVLPIGALKLRDQGELDTKIIAIPLDSTRRLINVDNFLDFAIHHDAAKQIIESWFLNYKGPRQTELIGWEDEYYAWEEVRKWKREG